MTDLFQPQLKKYLKRFVELYFIMKIEMNTLGFLNSIGIVDKMKLLD